MDRNTAKERARELVANMTLEEKASQLRYDAPAIPRLGLPAYNWWSEALHGVARAGTATVFPQAIGLAAAFDPEFLEEIADIIATEGRAKYNEASSQEDRDIYKGLTFWSPNINIFRDPRWGRGHETYGEDPYLTSRLGVAFVKGMQGSGPWLKAAACAKHFAVHSGPEALRHEFDARVSPKDLWETYLPAFEALVREAGVEAVMGAYNRINGEPACGSKTLLKDILRDKWGFEGHVVSDCWAIRDFHEHHRVTATAPQSAALALTSGCDLNCGNTYLHILQAWRDGLVTEQDISTACERLMATRIRLGLMDKDGPFHALGALDVDTPAHAQAAREAACKGMTLLKNDGILPLDMGGLKTIAVIGPNADSQAALEGNYSGKSSRYVTFLEGIRAACQETVRVLYARGSQLFEDRDSPLTQRDNGLSEAVAMARKADVVILCLGLDASLEGEQSDASNAFASGDKLDLELPDCQRRLVAAVMKTGKPVITVVAAGSALRVEEGEAVLWAWYPGQAGGLALADLLFGRVSPSGRLPVTFYRQVSDLPAFADYAMANRTYRYFGGEALYPFGFGLSYTRFSYSGAAFRQGVAEVELLNSGRMDGDEIVQVYLRHEHPDAPPKPVLCGFKRVTLKAGERRRVSVRLDKQAFTLVNQAGERIPREGSSTLYIGGSQPDLRSEALTGSRCLSLRV
ncbi:MAG: glycoside hydrolase family 3 C-terminal domain-containing protein [Christensenellales bacterium]